MQSFERIRKEIKNGELEEALERALKLVQKHGTNKQKKELTALFGQFRKFQREKAVGLAPDQSVINRIELGFLTILESIERTVDLNIADRQKQKAKENAKRFSGKIKYINNHQRFGFVKCNDLEDDIFFHFSSFVQNKAPIISQKVTFEIDKNEKGWFAKRMYLIDWRTKRKNKKSSKYKENRDEKLKVLEDDIAITAKKLIKKIGQQFQRITKK